MSHKRNPESCKTPKDEQRTPPSLYRALDARFHFDLDVACTRENCLSRNRYGFSKEDDAMKKEWGRFMMDNGEEASRFWCNPPYSEGMVEKFLKKGYQESLLGNTVVFLITCDVSPKYYRLCHFAAEWIAIDGRVIFLEEDGTPCNGTPSFGSMAIVFDSAQRKAQGNKTIVTRLTGWKNY